MSVEWLKVPIFDPNAHFTLSFRDWEVDAHLVRDELTVTQTMSNGAYRKATFHTAKELDLFLRMGLRRVLKRYSFKDFLPGTRLRHAYVNKPIFNT